ncbi:hypothetical protein R1flu_018486 [Riccia fluitans]|uniref:B box-type domain-containing protein n=1 Tax=Riccia fluitans TaxID=41844 RepID=A0ABD1ZG59_9MARC
MACAQCEEAQATVRCLDEKLDYCYCCSQQLHSKNARKHHQLETVVPTRLCDECETASAKLECLDCGGGKVPLAFCFDCCSKLHSKSARAGHSVQKFGIGKCLTSLLVDLGQLKGEDSWRRHPVGSVKAEPGLKEVIDLTGERDGEDELAVYVRQRLKPVKSEHGGPQKGPILGQKAASTSAAAENTGSGLSGKNSRNKKCPNLRKCKKEEAERQAHEELVRKRTKREVPEDGPRLRRAMPVRNYDDKIEVNTSEEEECSSSETSESDEDFRGTHKVKRGSVTVEAFVVDATDQEDTGPTRTGEPPEEPVSGIRFRIKKMLELGLHPDTPEIEAQQALNNAQRLLTKHNLEQAEVLEGNLTDTTSLVGGMRVVELRAKGRAKLGRMESWVLQLGWVISDNFDTRFYFKSGSSKKPTQIVFYGISQNADCAGYAFAATFNRITIMSAEYIIRSANDYEEAEKENPYEKNRGLKTRIARANYRRGIVAGLKGAVKQSRRAKTPKTDGGNAKTEKTEEFSDGDSWFEDDGEDGDFGPDSPGREDESDKSTKSAWQCMAITALVQHSEKVGEEFLKSKGIKLHKSSKRKKTLAWDQDAYVQGKNDAESIDINQKALEDVKRKKKKKV